MILKIVKYPDPILEKPGEPVSEFNDELRKFIADMFETMYASQGIGLAAQQVGVAKRVTVIDLSVGKDPAEKRVFVNPEIIERAGKLYEEEGCLSFPEIREKVSRAAHVRVRAQDAYGKWLRLMARSCSNVVCSMRSIILMEYFSSSASARSSVILPCARFARCNALVNGINL